MIFGENMGKKETTMKMISSIARNEVLLKLMHTKRTRLKIPAAIC